MILLNLDFMTGIGDFYLDTIECLEYAQKLKEQGHPVQLLFSSVRNKYLEHIKLDEIYDLETFHMFDSIEQLDRTVYFQRTIRECTHIPIQGKRWRIFSSSSLPKIHIPHYQRMDEFILHRKKPVLLPQFKNIIHDKKEEFIQNKNLYDFIHFRTRNAKVGNTSPHLEKMDKREGHDFTEKVTQKVFQAVKQSSKNYHVGSNDRYFVDTMKKLPNVFDYSFSNLDLFMNDYDYYKHIVGKKIDREIILNRFYENVAEFISLENAQNFISSTSMCWVSHFLSYGLINNKNNYKFVSFSDNSNLKLP